MGVYAGLADCTDPVVSVEDTDIDAAERALTAVLRNRGIAPAAVTSEYGLSLLRDAVVAEATAGAARRQAVEGNADSAMWAKSTAYMKHAQALAMRLDRESLGIAVTGSGSAGYGVVGVGRG